MLKTRWETIRDDVAGMLADGVPLEDITGKLEKLKKEYQKPLTNEEWIKSLDTEQLADVLADVSLWIHPFMKKKNRFELLKKQFREWLKEEHHD